MHAITVSTIGQVMRFSHDMQHVLAHSCWSPSAVHMDSTQISAGTQLNIDWQDWYWAMHGPWAAQVQHVAQSAGAAQSTPPSLDETSASASVPSSAVDVASVSTVVLVVAPPVLVSSPPSLELGAVVGALVTVSVDAESSSESSSDSLPPQPTSTPMNANRSHRIA